MISTTPPLAKSLKAKIFAVDDRLPAGALSRPANSVCRPWAWSESTVIFQTLNLE